jgi:asparagine synthase (glutamine-hydrolysing)
LKMLAALLHEPFYAQGTWIDESLGVYLGWTARKDSFSAGNPLRNEQGDISLVFSGEEYPEPDIARRLKGRGHSLNGGGASYLVHLYEEDPNFPANLNGLFHGVLTDQTRKTAMLFNDRYGMHRVYYYESTEAFYFAAEAKAILAARPELRTPDPKSLGEFVAYSCVLDDRTIFKNIHALPAGSSWIFRNGSVERKSTYFQPHEWEEQSPLEPNSYYEELRDVFLRNLPRYFKGSQPIGMTLTGGLDTRAIMAWHKGAPGSLPCYTFGGMLRDSEDVQVARRVATTCQQPHEVIQIGDEFLARFPHYAERSVYLTEGGVDVYRSSDLYLSEKARSIAPVKIVGTYGSEIIRHDVMLSPYISPVGLYDSDFAPYIDRARLRYDGFQREHPVTFAAFRQSPWFHHGILSLEETQLSVRSPYLDNDFVRTVYRAPKSDGVNNDVRLPLIREGNPVLGRIRTDRGENWGSGGIAASFARSLLEFTVKAEYAFDYGMPQWLAQIDHWTAPLHVERIFLGRHKSSYFRIWYRGVLSEYLREILLDSRTLARPYFEPKAVEAVVRGHLKGNRNYTREIHKMLTLELLHRLFFDPR